MIEITEPDKNASCIACHCENQNMLVEVKMAKSEDSIKNCITICTDCLAELFSELVHEVDMFA